MMVRYLRKIVSTALLLLLIGAGAGLVVFQAGGGKLMSVQSGSMEPAINKGGLVAVKTVPTEEIREGDIITYTNPLDRSQTITHRVTGYMPSIMSGGKPYFVTKGDANPTPDQPVQASAVVGRVSFDIPYAGHVINFMKHPLGLLLVAYIPALIITIHEIRRLAAYYKTIRPYQLRESKHTQTASVPVALFLSGFVLLAALVGTATQVFAALHSQVALTGNTISSIPLGGPNPPQPPGDNHDVTCTNNTDVNFSQTTDQQAASGNATVQGNTNGSSATSGNASNSNSSSVDVSVSNSCKNV